MLSLSVLLLIAFLLFFVGFHVVADVHAIASVRVDPGVLF
jgi:hypothetical protein